MDDSSPKPNAGGGWSHFGGDLNDDDYGVSRSGERKQRISICQPGARGAAAPWLVSRLTVTSVWREHLASLELEGTVGTRMARYRASCSVFYRYLLDSHWGATLEAMAEVLVNAEICLGLRAVQKPA